MIAPAFDPVVFVEQHDMVLVVLGLVLVLVLVPVPVRGRGHIHGWESASPFRVAASGRRRSGVAGARG